MPKNKFTPKEPLAKLPLAARKEIRDNYESRREELEGKASELLGVKFTFNFNPNEIWAYYQDDNQNPGYVLAGYAEGFVSGLESYKNTYGEEGIKDFNEVVTKSELSVNANSLGNDAPTISCGVKDGVIQILFHHEKLGYNASWLTHAELLAAIDGARPAGLSLEAKHSIKEYWEAEVEDLTEEFETILGVKDIKLDPNFDENYEKMLKGKKDDKSWMRNLGSAILAYFKDGLKSKLEYLNVKEDELVREGILELLTEKTIKMRIVDKVKNGYYNGISFEDGVLYLETTVDNWYTNTSDIAAKLIDLL